MELCLANQFPKWPEHRVLQARGIKHEVIGFTSKRHEVEPERPGSRQHSESHVRAPGGHRSGHRKMCACLFVVPNDGRGVHAHAAKLEIQKRPGARANLAIDIAEVSAAEVFYSPEAKWVPVCHDQALLAMNQSDDCHVAASENLTNWTKRVLARSGIEQTQPAR